MNKRIKELFQLVELWPKERQENAARVLRAMEAQATSQHQLTDEQAAEVERRLAKSNPRFLTLKDVRARFAKLSA